MSQSQSRAHAHRSPSDSGRWLNCPGALNLTSILGPRPSSIYAAEGTWAHQVREDCLDLGMDAYDFIGHRMAVDGYAFTWTEADANFLQPGIDRIRQFDGRLVVEYQVNLERWMPDDFGTLDTGIVGKDLIVINDLKWGQGELVEADHNTQQMIYALGFWQNVARFETDATEFLLMIDQPRAMRKSRNREIVFDDLDEDDTDEGEIEIAAPGEFRITLKELLAFGRELKTKARATEDPDAPRVPGHKQCRWCPATKIEGMCPEYEVWNMANLGLTFENLDEAEELGTLAVPRTTITPERRSVLIRSWPQIERWYKRMHANALADALSGDTQAVPGLKAVEGRHGKRVWADPDAAEAFLTQGRYIDPETLDVKRGYSLSHAQSFTQKMISPAVAETLVGKGKLPIALVERGKPKPVLVSASDPKPAITAARIEFDNLENDDDDNGER